MRLGEAITGIDSRKRNTVSEEEKIAWLSELDGRIFFTILSNHEGCPEKMPVYTGETSRETELLIPAPYDRVYLLWLEAQIDFTNGESTRYENSYTMFNVAFQEFARFYHRTHMPKGKKLKIN